MGCSWTYGVAVSYTEGMSWDQLMETAWDEKICDTLSWRGILAQHLESENFNLSVGGSSNQKQFRLATEFFSQQYKKIKNDYDKILVIWGITSTARNEIFCLETNSQKNFLYNDKEDFSKFFVKYSYSHQNEVNTLARQMQHWNDFFESQGIENYWFDTFNTHNYHAVYDHVSADQYIACSDQDWPSYEDFSTGTLYNTKPDTFSHICKILDIPKIDRLICGNQSPRDLAYLLAIDHGFNDKDNSFHVSGWQADCTRIEFLQKIHLLNPITYHPTCLAHQKIADMLLDKIYG